MLAAYAPGCDRGCADADADADAGVDAAPLGWLAGPANAAGAWAWYLLDSRKLMSSVGFW